MFMYVRRVDYRSFRTATAVPGVFEAAPVHAAPVQKRVFTGGAPPLNPAIIDRLKQA